MIPCPTPRPLARLARRRRAIQDLGVFPERCLQFLVGPDEPDARQSAIAEDSPRGPKKSR